ncbi:hypothetical protein ACUSIJ_24160 [Pseudochelatococcus sp. B33]
MPHTELTEDRQHVLLGDEALDAQQVSALIRELIALRAQMTPAFSGSFEPESDTLIELDNLLWSTGIDPTRRAIDLGLYNDGLGWMRMKLSRAMVEDLANGLGYTVVKLVRLLDNEYRKVGQPDLIVQDQ